MEAVKIKINYDLWAQNILNIYVTIVCDSERNQFVIISSSTPAKANLKVQILILV